MKKKELFVFSFICCVFSIITFSMTFGVFSNQPMREVLSSNILRQVNEESTEIDGCTETAPIEGLDMSTEPHIQQLAQYQSVCESFLTDTLMIFINMPYGAEAIEAEATRLAKSLLEFERYGIKPLVVAEPTDEIGLINLQRFSTKSHYPSLLQFFKALKAKGVAESAMGVWLPFPEPNVPSWDSVGSTYANFGQNVNLYMQALQTEYPNTLATVLLNATTYEPTDLEWNEGDYLALTPWIQDIKDEYIDSVGIQGFPWIAPSNREPRRLFDPEEFLQPDYAISLAKEARTKKIWYNTGTFASKYTQVPEKKNEVLPSERKAILENIILAANRIKNVQANGYDVSINIFAEDKTDRNEDTDWSYLSTPDEEFVFVEFMKAATEEGIDVSMYDRARL